MDGGAGVKLYGRKKERKGRDRREKRKMKSGVGESG